MLPFAPYSCGATPTTGFLEHESQDARRRTVSLWAPIALRSIITGLYKVRRSKVLYAIDVYKSKFSESKLPEEIMGETSSLYMVPLTDWQS